jgi:hypothetical protein
MDVNIFIIRIPVERLKKITIDRKRSEKFMQTVRNTELLETFESERSNALERIVENVHSSKTKETLYINVSFMSTTQTQIT